MRVSVVRYEKLKNLGNYEHERVGVEVELESGETPNDALKRAQAFVARALAPKITDSIFQNAKTIVANPDDYTPHQLRDAQEHIRLAQGQDDDIPF